MDTCKFHLLCVPVAEALNTSQAKDEEQGKWDCAAFAKSYPMTAIAAVNEVLFTQHGYQGKPAKEDPR